MPAEPAELARLKDLARAIIQSIEAIEARAKVEESRPELNGAPMPRATRLR